MSDHDPVGHFHDLLDQLFASYDAIEDACVRAEPDEVALLVETRGDLVRDLALLADELMLPDDLKAEISEAETRLHHAVARLHDQLFQQLDERRRVAFAVSRYAESS